MAYRILKKLLSPEELRIKVPLSISGYKNILKHRQEIKNILDNKDKRLLIIIGPCSAWPSEAVLEYASRLKKLNDKVKDALKLVMRVYVQKPRTVKGWGGALNQPDPLVFPDIEAGMLYSRKMMVDVIEMGLPIANEALFTHNMQGFLELLSWVAIGARSSEDQEHRIFASSVECAVGMKNPTHGVLKIAVNSVVSAQHPHIFAIDGYEIETSGNQYAHLVLRGINGTSNYNIENLVTIKSYMDLHCIKNQSVIIDVSHDNCILNRKKDFKMQPDIIFNILDELQTNSSCKELVKGFMIESFLLEGNQEVTHNINKEGLSITDPCIGWEDTENMLLKLASLRR